MLINAMTFDKLAHVGAPLHFHAQVSWGGHTLVEVLVMVEVE